MDNRRFSARAEVSGAGPVRREQEALAVPFWDRAIELTRLNWEVIAFVVLLAITILSRFVDLGSRAMHHDESIHAYFSNYYLKSGDYTSTPGFNGGYDPTYHGPFLYTMTALSFFLFGANDMTSRLMPALFGVILVALCWLLRPFIGRWGALIAAFLVMISPSISYYSRSLRHDIFALTGTMLLFVSILWYLRTHQSKWVYLGSLGLVVAFASHELTFIIAFMFALALIIPAFVAPLFEQKGTPVRLLTLLGTVLLGCLSVFFVYEGVHQTSGSSFMQIGIGAVCALFTVGMIGFMAFQAREVRVGMTAEEDANPVASAGRALLTQRWTIVGGVLVFLAVYTVLFTNMLTRPDLWLSGFTKGFEYWTSQQHVQRGNQPEFYYAMLMFIYEPLALFAGSGTILYLIFRWLRSGAQEALSFAVGLAALIFVAFRLALGQSFSPVDILFVLVGLAGLAYPIVRWITAGSRRSAPVHDIDAVDIDDEPSPATDEYGVALPSMAALRGFALGFLAFWAIGSFIAFSLAGERMPWLNMQIALPFSLLAAAGIGVMINRIEWRQVLKGGGVFLGVVVILFIFAAFMFVAHLQGVMPAAKNASGQVDDLQMLIRGVILALFALGLMALAGYLAYKLSPIRAVKIVGITFALLFVGYGVRSMTLLNYRHGDVPNEMAVYTQTAPDVPLVADMILRLSRDETSFDQRSAADVTGGRSLEISMDQDESVTWPFDWYFRDQRNYKYFNLFNVDANGNKTPKTDLTNAIAPNTPVIFASQDSENTDYMKNLVKDRYTTQEYVLNWWFPEETYKKDNVGDLKTAGDWLFSDGWKYLLYRDPGAPLGSRNFYLHIRKDLAVKTGFVAPASTTPSTQGQQTGPGYGMLEMRGAGADKGQFSAPRGIATGPDGSFYVVDTNNMRIEKFDKTGKFVATIGNGSGTGDGQFQPYSADAQGTGPGGIAVDKDGNLYVADTWNHRIQKFDKDGRFLTKWGSVIFMGDQSAANDPDKDSKFFGPRGIAVGPDGHVYVTDTGNKRVLVFDSNGKFLSKIDSGLNADKVAQKYAFSQPGEMNEPIGITVDQASNVYVADTFNKRIEKFDAQGKFVSQWPIDSPNWDAGPTLEPFLAIDAQGNIYATAPTGKKVLKFSPDGKKLGEKASEGAVTLITPTGITVASDGSIYIVDTGANGVVKFGPMTP